jgi:hypothetical protein
MDPADVPEIDANNLAAKSAVWSGEMPANLLLEISGRNGRAIRLCDFASAGQAGSPYRSWLPVVGIKATPFGKDNPLRSGRATPR